MDDKTTKKLLIAGAGAESIVTAVRNVQALLGITDIGEALAFCVNITTVVIEQAEAGQQLGFYDHKTGDIQLYSSSHLDTLIELYKETTSAPEDPPPD